MSSFVHTDILVRHLTGDPADQAARATAFLADLTPTPLPSAAPSDADDADKKDR